MNVNSSAQFCSRCHSYSHFPTYEEWLESEHSHADVECVGCHNPMSLELKTEDTVELCLGCHVEIAEEASQGEHGLPGESCDVCHMIKSYGDFESGEAGMTGARIDGGTIAKKLIAIGNKKKKHIRNKYARKRVDKYNTNG